VLGVTGVFIVSRLRSCNIEAVVVTTPVIGQHQRSAIKQGSKRGEAGLPPTDLLYFCIMYHAKSPKACYKTGGNTLRCLYQPPVSTSVLDTLLFFYDDDEIAEFRHDAFLEMAGSIMPEEEKEDEEEERKLLNVRRAMRIRRTSTRDVQ
jgi:hypothetical protein